jgi:hypothetical protein
MGESMAETGESRTESLLGPSRLAYVKNAEPSLDEVERFETVYFRPLRPTVEAALKSDANEPRFRVEVKTKLHDFLS